MLPKQRAADSSFPRSSFYATQRNTGKDILGQGKIDDEQRQDGQSQRQVNGTVFRLVCVTLQQADHDGPGVHLLVRQQDHGLKQPVPGVDEAEDGLGCHSGLYHGDDDLVEGPHLAGAVHPGGFQNLHGKIGQHVLPHEEHRGGRGNGRQDQRDEAVGHAQLIAHFVEADHGHLGGDHHNGHHKGEERVPAPPAVGHNGEGCQGGEVHRAEGAAGGDDGRVHKAPEGVEGLAGDGRPVALQEGGGNEGQGVLLNLKGASGGVHKHDPEGQDAHDGQNNQKRIGKEFENLAFPFMFHGFASLSVFLGLGIPVTHEVEQEAGDNGNDHEHNHAGRGGTGIHVGAGEGLLEDKHAGGHRGVVGHTVVEQLGNVEHIQAADYAGNQRKQQDCFQIGKGDVEEGLPGVGAVQIRGLKNVGADAQNAGDQNQHGIAIPLPELNKGHNQLGGQLVLGKGKGSVYDSQRHQNIVHRPLGVAEHGVEQHGDGSRGNDVGHIQDDLEEALALELVVGGCKPGGEKQRQKNLGNEVDDPDFEGVLQGCAEHIVGQDHLKVLENVLFQEVPLFTHALGIGKAENQSVNGGVKGKNKICGHKGNDEHVPIFRIAEGLSFFHCAFLAFFQTLQQGAESIHARCPPAV